MEFAHTTRRVYLSIVMSMSNVCVYFSKDSNLKNNLSHTFILGYFQKRATTKKIIIGIRFNIKFVTSPDQ